jgi:hypothetical protein
LKSSLILESGWVSQIDQPDCSSFHRTSYVLFLTKRISGQQIPQAVIYTGISGIAIGTLLGNRTSNPRHTSGITGLSVYGTAPRIPVYTPSEHVQRQPHYSLVSNDVSYIRLFKIAPAPIIS